MIPYPKYGFYDLRPNVTEMILDGINLSTVGGKVGQYTVQSFDIALFLGFAVALYFLREVLSRLIFIPLGIKLVGSHRPIFIEKWVENCWFCVYYPISFVIGLVVCWNEPFFSNPYYFFNDWPILANRHRASLLFTIYYGLGFGFYLQSIVALVTFETRRKDFWVMLAHHLATCILISVSWASAHDRFGAIVLLLHDFVDIFLYVSKALHYMKMEIAKTIGFVLFALAYFFARIVYFPLRVIISVLAVTTSCQAAGFLVRANKDSKFYGEISTYGLCVGGYCFSMYWFLVGFMCFLYCLHVYWFYLICSMIKAAIASSGIAQDIRSDSEDEAIAAEEKLAKKRASGDNKKKQ